MYEVKSVQSRAGDPSSSQFLMEPGDQPWHDSEAVLLERVRDLLTEGGVTNFPWHENTCPVGAPIFVGRMQG